MPGGGQTDQTLLPVPGRHGLLQRAPLWALPPPQLLAFGCASGVFPCDMIQLPLLQPTAAKALLGETPGEESWLAGWLAGGWGGGIHPLAFPPVLEPGGRVTPAGGAPLKPQILFSHWGLHKRHR